METLKGGRKNAWKRKIVEFRIKKKRKESFLEVLNMESNWRTDNMLSKI